MRDLGVCISILLYAEVPRACFQSFSPRASWASLGLLGFPGGSEDKESACKAGDHVRSLGWEDPLEKGMAIYPSILAWEILWPEEPWQATVCGVAKSQTRLSD